MMPNIVPVEDIDVSKELERNFKKAGMNILTQTRVISAKPTKKGVEVLVEKKMEHKKPSSQIAH
jgi:dihydrolipoamide dehydrogenase